MSGSLDGIKFTAATKAALDKAKELNLTISSGYRSPEHSVEVGGYKNDDHTKGLALDFVGTKTNMDKFAKWAKGSGLFRWVGWQVAGHFNHVHVSWTTNGSSVTLPSGTVEKQGSTGSIVKAIQSLLGGLKVDGIFGAKTKQAVEDFQEHRNLEQDGIVGQKTWNSLTEGKGKFFF
jgi:hypothetical protein